MRRKTNGFFIAAMISVGIHIIIFLSLIVFTPSFRYVQARPGSITVSLGGSDYNGLQGGRSIPKPTHGQLFQQEAKTDGVSVSSHDQIQVGSISGTGNAQGGEQPGQGGGVRSLAIPLQGNPIPPYPERARRRGYQGTVKLEIEILTNGRVGKIQVEKSSGYTELDDSALRTLKGWRFLPATSDGTLDGVPVRKIQLLPVKFILT
jgi:TonB family protein